MTFSALEIDPTRHSLRWYSAGAPPIFLHSRNGYLKALTCSGTPLGVENFSVGEVSHAIEPGQRILMFTDGAPELGLPSNKQLGLRNLARIFQDTANLEAEKVLSQMVATMDKRRVSEPQMDDIAFLLCEIGQQSEVKNLENRSEEIENR
jgi:sigma-B regulation protein RsbU (phosphoserine phosphatase)